MGRALQRGRGADLFGRDSKWFSRGADGAKEWEGQAPAESLEPLLLLAGRKRPRPPQDAVSGRRQLREKGRGCAQQPPPASLPPPTAGHRNSRSRGARAYVRQFTLPRAPCSGESQGRPGPLCQGSKMPSCRASPPQLTRSENPLNPGCNLMSPACPAPPPAEAARAPLRTLISMTTWEDSLAGAGGTRSHQPPAPSRRPPRATALQEPHSHKCCFQLIAKAGEGEGPGRRPRPEAGAPLVGSCVRSGCGVHQHHPCVQV